MITKTLVCSWCGQEFQRTDYPSRFRWAIGNYKKTYCSKYCAMVAAREGYRPTQGVIMTSKGVLYSREPNHPYRNKNNQVPLAHLIMEDSIGRHIQPNEVIHHRDGNPLNNHIDNLQLMILGEHVSLHNNLKERDANGRFIKNLP